MDLKILWQEKVFYKQLRLHFIIFKKWQGSVYQFYKWQNYNLK